MHDGLNNADEEREIGAGAAQHGESHEIILLSHGHHLDYTMVLFHSLSQFCENPWCVRETWIHTLKLN